VIFSEIIIALHENEKERDVSPDASVFDARSVRLIYLFTLKHPAFQANLADHPDIQDEYQQLINDLPKNSFQDPIPTGITTFAQYAERLDKVLNDNGKASIY
jgi:hypothetical protein